MTSSLNDFVLIRKLSGCSWPAIWDVSGAKKTEDQNSSWNGQQSDAAAQLHTC